MKRIIHNLSIIGLLIFILQPSQQIFGQISFNKVNTPYKSDFPLAITDINNDHVLDLISASTNGTLFWTNLDHLTQAKPINIIDSLQNTGPGIFSWVSIAVADINNDHVKDIFIGDVRRSKLFLSNGNGSYIKHFLPDTFFAQSANFHDIDLDGDLDLFVCNDDSANYVYLNDGSGNLSRSTNIFPNSTESGNYGAVWSDVDGDLDLDLYISKCRSFAFDSTDLRRINLLYQNEGNGSYQEKASIFGIADGSQSWSADFGDIDNDGDLDLLIANHKARNRLYEQINDSFVELTFSAGLDVSDIDDYQSSFVDFDNDGFLDILFANSENASRIYLNNQDKTFSPIVSNVPGFMKSFALGDLNNDGFTDIYLSKGSADSLDEIWLNNANLNNYLTIELDGPAFNFDAIGSIVKLYGDWGVQTREIRAGESYGIQNSNLAHFGIGLNTDIDSLVVHWPSGEKCLFGNLGIKQFHIVDTSCASISVNLSSQKNIHKNTIEVITYPNPGSKSIFIHTPKKLYNAEIKITNIIGEIIYMDLFDSNLKLDISNFSNGIYFVQIFNQKHYSFKKFQVKN